MRSFLSQESSREGKVRFFISKSTSIQQRLQFYINGRERTKGIFRQPWKTKKRKDLDTSSASFALNVPKEYLRLCHDSRRIVFRSLIKVVWRGCVCSIWFQMSMISVDVVKQKKFRLQERFRELKNEERTTCNIGWCTDYSISVIDRKNLHDN